MEELKKRQNLTLAAMEYSLKRIDLLIVSISSGGIYVCLETLKFLEEQDMDNSRAISIAGVVFLFAIIINFISQFLGHAANKKDYEWCDKRIEVNDTPNEAQKIEIEKLNDQSEYYNKWTIRCNKVGATLMCFGLLTLIFYFWVTF